MSSPGRSLTILEYIPPVEGRARLEKLAPEDEMPQMSFRKSRWRQQTPGLAQTPLRLPCGSREARESGNH
eukprot:6650579-Pyramimonas_sp.AAC.1